MVGGQIVVDERGPVGHIQAAVQYRREQVFYGRVLVGPKVREEFGAHGGQAVGPGSNRAGG